MRVGRRRGWIGLVSLAAALAVVCPVAKADVVGTLSGAFQATPMGAATYTVPLDLPPGVGGMAPKLSIVYNSMAPDSIMGPGFSLGGLSAISRCNWTSAQDGIARGVEYGGGDRFCLDGQRLVTNQTYGAVGDEYRTEVESFAQIRSIGGSQGNPAYWVVKTKSGITETYGQTQTFPAAGSGHAPAVWLLEKQVDSVGNEIVYHYGSDSGEYQISEIDYGGNPNRGTPDDIAVRFTYQVRQGYLPTGYTAGIKLQRTLRLASISAVVGGATSRVWNLQYQQSSAQRMTLHQMQRCNDGGTAPDTDFCGPLYTPSSDTNPARDVVVGVQECDGAGDCAPATEFTWNDFVGDYTDDLVSTYSLSGTWKKYAADLDGNGTADVLGLKHDVANQQLDYFTVKNVWTGGTLVQYAPLPATIGNDTDSRNAVVDFNGDGYPDVALVSRSLCRIDIESWTNAGPQAAGALLIDHQSVNQAINTDRYECQPPPPNPSPPPCSGCNPQPPCPGCSLQGVSQPPSLQTSSAAASLATQPPGTESGDTLYADMTGLFSGDVDGDGYGDLVIVGNGTSNEVGYVVYPGGPGQPFAAGNLHPYTVHLGQYMAGGTHTALFGDFLGIGAERLLFVQKTTSGADIVACGAISSCVHSAVGNDDLSSAAMFLADVNGDGAADLVFLKQIGSTAYVDVALSKGNGYFANLVQTAVGLPSSNAVQVAVGDDDGDGLADIALLPTDGTAAVTIAHAKGDGRFTRIATHGLPQPLPASHTDLSGDFSGEGKGQILAFGPGKAVLIRAQGAPYLRVQGITDGLGAAIAIDYAPLSSASVVSEDHLNAAYPLTPAHAGMWVIASQTDYPDSDANHARKVTYHYADPRVDRQGRGFAGFSAVTRCDSATSICQVDGYRQDFPYLGALIEQRKSLQVSNRPISDTRTTYDSLTQARTAMGSYFVYPVQVVARSYEINDANGSPVTATETDNAYDDHGNLTDSTVKSYDGDIGGSSPFVTHTVNQYQDDASQWLLGRLTDTVVTRTNPDGASASRESSFTYDPTTGLLASETVQPNDSGDWLTKTYQRDGFGNVVVTTVTGAGIATRSRTAEFSAAAPYYGRFRTRSCNALGQCDSAVYDEATGNVIAATDANGQTTRYQYDVFGRKAGSSVQQNGLNLSSSIARFWCSSQSGYCHGAPTGVFGELSTDSKGQQAVVVYDAGDREVRRATRLYNGSTVDWIETLTVYDAAGRKAAISSPRFADDSQTYWTYTVYDSEGRPVRVAAPRDQNTYPTGAGSSTGSITTFSYSGLTTTVTDPRGLTTTKTVNALGKLVSVTDAAGKTTHYAYDPYQNLVATTDPAGHTTTMVYDARGRKIAMTDPDMGHWSYRYDALGELTEQTDADGHVIDTRYDLLGRPVQRIDKLDASTVEQTTAWVYDTRWKGALTSVSITKPDGRPLYAKSLTYTAFGAVADVTETIEGTAYTLGYQYDSQARLTETDYPDGFAVAYGYNAYGQEDRVYKPGDPSNFYWRADSWDHWGKVNNATDGNGVATYTGRDLAVGRVSALLGGPGGTNGTLAFNYAWDEDGNLTSRVDGDRNNLTQTFAYDGLNRLTTVTTSNGGVGENGTVNVAYDPLGDITHKDDVGDYQYAGAHPHAVTQAGAQAFTYDAAGNTLTAGARTYTWSSYNKPLKLADGAGDESDFVYGPDRERVRQVYRRTGSLPTAVDYVGGGLFESDLGPAGGNAWKNYILAPTGVVAVLTQSPGSPDAIAYFHHDNLGSIVAVTDAHGALVQRIAYDAFGRRHVVGSLLGDYATPWGYTGHLQLDNLDLVHMGGRVYDPVIGRFLSPDPTVQAPDDLQNWNRYAYVINNPLTLTDPSGYCFLGCFWQHIDIAQIAAIAVAIVASAVGQVEVWGLTIPAWGTAALGGFAAGLIASGGNLTDGLIGAVAALAFYGIGEQFQGAQLFEGGVPTEAGVEKIIEHGVVGGLQSAAEGGDFGSGFLSAGAAETFSGATGDYRWAGSGAVGVAERVTVAAAIGGTAAVIGGGKFANGAVTGAFSEAFNEGMEHLHEGQAKPIVIDGHDGSVVIIYPDGSIEIRADGTRSWRNNNPGNLAAGKFANAHGAIGEAAGFGVFPDAVTGKSALAALFGTSTYKALTLDAALDRYAPPSENNTAAYQHFVQHYTGLSGSTSIGSLNQIQVNNLTNAIQQFEGWRPGVVNMYYPGSSL